SRDAIPVYRMLTTPLDELDRRAHGLAKRLSSAGGVRAEVIDGVSTIGGGSAPGSALPTRLIAVEVNGLSAAALEARVRGADPPVIARIDNDKVLLDPRTMAIDEESAVIDAVVGAAGR